MGLGRTELDVLRLGALLHDIGKIGISDAVLRKPGRLTAEEEFEPSSGTPCSARASSRHRVPGAALPIVELHHERPDGTGYPYGLRGDEIPLLARIVHVADAFDAMTSARAYRPGGAGGGRPRREPTAHPALFVGMRQRTMRHFFHFSAGSTSGRRHPATAGQFDSPGDRRPSTRRLSSIVQRDRRHQRRASPWTP